MQPQARSLMDTRLPEIRQDLLPASGIGIEERTAGTRDSGRGQAGWAQTWIREPQEIQVHRFVEKLDEVGAFSCQYRDSQALVLYSNSRVAHEIELRHPTAKVTRG